MKRCVKEFLNDEISKHNELGILTDYEAVKLAVENIEKWEAQ